MSGSPPRCLLPASVLIVVQHPVDTKLVSYGAEQGIPKHFTHRGQHLAALSQLLEKPVDLLLSRLVERPRLTELNWGVHIQQKAPHV
jgi:hypothetical protein